MAQTLEGKQKKRETMIKKYGSEEAYLEFMRNIGKQGGKKSTGHAFAHGKVNPSEAGKKGSKVRWPQ